MKRILLTLLVVALSVSAAMANDLFGQTVTWDSLSLMATDGASCPSWAKYITPECRHNTGSANSAK